VAGEYTIHYYADQSALRSPTTSGSVQFVFNWNDGTARQATANLTLIATSSASSYIQGAIPIYAGVGTAVTYFSNLTACPGPGKYDVHVSAEQTQ